jgi:hypothetical protein
MIAAAGLLSVILGAVVAYSAQRFPDHFAGHVEALETSAGVLLMAGLALAGCALPVVL